VGGGGGDEEDEDPGLGYRNCMRPPLAETDGPPGNEFQRDPRSNGRDRLANLWGVEEVMDTTKI
jgi:hypothetical protein